MKKLAPLLAQIAAGSLLIWAGLEMYSSADLTIALLDLTALCR